MKKLVFALAALAVALVSCTKGGEQEKDTTPAKLLSFEILKADNAFLDKDYFAELITPNMVIRVPGGGMDKSFKATIKVGEFDKLYVNGAAVELTNASAKVDFQGKFAVDIEVVNTKSSKSAAYEVKIGKILQSFVTSVGSYTEPGTTLNSDLLIAINPTNNSPYILYSRKNTAAETPDANNRLACINWTGSAFAPVGALGFTGDTRQAIMCDIAFDGEVPYILHYGEKTAYICTLRKFNGSEWETVGGEEFGNRITGSYGKPKLYFLDGKINFVTTGNTGKTDPDYRNATRYSFDGTSWTKTALIPGLPEYGVKGGSDGMFYAAVPATDSKGNVYIVTSNNTYGYYLFKANDWSKMVDNYIPEGETYGVPSSLSVKVGPSGEIYILGAVSSKAQYQLYRYNKETASGLDLISGPIQGVAGSSGAVATAMRIGVNPLTGQVIGIYSKDNKLYFGFIDENEQWTEFSEINDAKTLAAGDAFAVAYASNGDAYIATVAKVDGVSSIELYKYGLEDDILPE